MYLKGPKSSIHFSYKGLFTNYVSRQRGGGKGVCKMLTMADKGGRGGKTNADNG